MKNKRILLVIDWILKPTGWSFLDALASLGYDCDILDEDVPVKYDTKLKKVFCVWPKYIKLGFKAYLRRNDYDVIVAWQGVAGLWYACFKRLFFAKGAKNILTAGFYYTTKNRSKLNAWIRYHFMKFALRAVDYAFCYSKNETKKYNELFQGDYQKFLFTYFGVNTNRSNIQLAQSIPPENYILSVGTSNRDYETFFKAVDGLDARVVVIAKRYNVAGLKIPNNVELKFDIYGDEYWQIFWKSKLIVIPLEDPEMSGGTTVLLDAMIYGKALVVTRSWSLMDHVTHMENGLLVAPHDSDDLREKIMYLLAHPQEIDRLASNAQKTAFEKFSMLEYARRVSEAIDRL
ncbi:MAG: glycosyltransferase family 4 protein [candidate division KSB1 bacterium]|nr:glycosyltransferase family 4 protein [candidate division KSB1 bacterium]